MAKVRRNIVIDGLSGTLNDQLVIRTVRGGRTIIAAKPQFAPDHVFTPAQIMHQSKFREAVAYARRAMKEEPLYAAQARGTALSAFNIALADFMHPPEILAIDVTGYTGQVGETIRAQVQDDVMVKAVKIIIADARDESIEQGEAIPAAGFWWHYTTTTRAPSANVKVSVQAWDLPGHRVEKQA